MMEYCVCKVFSHDQYACHGYTVFIVQTGFISFCRQISIGISDVDIVGLRPEVGDFLCFKLVLNTFRTS